MNRSDMRCFTAQHTKIGLILFFGRAVGHHHVVRHEIHLYVSDLKPTMIFWLFLPTYFLEIYGAALYICTHRNCRSYARRSMLEKRGEFFQLIYKGFFCPKCLQDLPNIRVLVLRFLCMYYETSFTSTWKWRPTFLNFKRFSPSVTRSLDPRDLDEWKESLIQVDGLDKLMTKRFKLFF
jgi:hypothetical protein